jgi:hypothetical protein
VTLFIFGLFDLVHSVSTKKGEGLNLDINKHSRELVLFSVPGEKKKVRHKRTVSVSSNLWDPRKLYQERSDQICRSAPGPICSAKKKSANE